LPTDVFFISIANGSPTGVWQQNFFQNILNDNNGPSVWRIPASLKALSICGCIPFLKNLWLQIYMPYIIGPN
jgi:hypothetical protein